MKKLSFILRPLLPIVLLGWLGLAQPAAAQQTVTLSGRVTDAVGNAVPDALVCAHLPTEQWWEGFCYETEAEGSFQLRVPPAEYVVTVRPVFPLRQTRRRLEASGAGVAALMLTVSRQPMPFVPDDPPKAALISISAPTADGEVTLTGSAGSVAPDSAVIAITLETGHFTTAQAAASGSFTATLSAPAGTSILIKADPFGTTVAEFLPASGGESDRTLLSNGERGGDPGLLAVLPGTILRVADPPGAGIPIGGAGRRDTFSLPAWTFHGSSIPRPSPLATPSGSVARSGWIPPLYKNLTIFRHTHLSGLSDSPTPMGQVSSAKIVLLPPSSLSPGSRLNGNLGGGMRAFPEETSL